MKIFGINVFENNNIISNIDATTVENGRGGVKSKGEEARIEGGKRAIMAVIGAECL